MIRPQHASKTSLFLLAAGVSALLFTGCGGSATNNDTIGQTPATGPVVAGLDPLSGSEVSGLGTLANANPTPASGQTGSNEPSASDVAYGTTATAVTVLSGQPPLSGAANYFGTGDYGDGTANAAPVPPGTTVAFRAYLVNGQTAGPSSRTLIPIKSVVLTSTDAAIPAQALYFAFTSNGTSAGPFASATYVSPNFTIPAATPIGVHTFSVTVTDTAGQSTRTDFQITVGTPAAATVKGAVRAAVKRR